MQWRSAAPAVFGRGEDHENAQPLGDVVEAMVDAGSSDFVSSRRRHTRLQGDWSSDVCSSDLGIGGSATNDGGSGMARAFGYRFIDRDGKDIPEGGAALARPARIDGQTDPRLVRPSIEVACDVRNPLLGPEGASAVYGPQKGATPEIVRELDTALARYADVVEAFVGRPIRDVPGAGAA